MIVGYAPINGYNEETEEKKEWKMGMRAALENHRHRNVLLVGDFNASMRMKPGGELVWVTDNGIRLQGGWKTMSWSC